MASDDALRRALMVCATTYPRDISKELTQIYRRALADVPDGALSRAVDRHVATAKFFPTPAELRELAGANDAPFVDCDALLSDIWTLATYHPARGTTPPRVSTVRERFGDSVAEAYGVAGGGSRLYSTNETTASIARREFAVELRALVKSRGAAALPSVRGPVLLPAASAEPVVFDAPQVTGGFKRLAAGGTD